MSVRGQAEQLLINTTQMVAEHSKVLRVRAAAHCAGHQTHMAHTASTANDFIVPRYLQDYSKNELLSPSDS